VAADKARTEAEEWEWRQQYLLLPDPLATVPARCLSAQGFAERVLRLIAKREKRRSAEDILALIRERCELLVWEGR
jgi:hypothetical protein